MKINWKQAKIRREELRSGSRESIMLGEAFAIFDLTKGEDLKTIERTARLYYSNYIGACSNPGLYDLLVDYDAFCEIWDYAKEKEEMLIEFQRHFIKSHMDRLDNRMTKEARGED